MQVFLILGKKLLKFLFSLKPPTPYIYIYIYIYIIQLAYINNIHKRIEDMNVHKIHTYLSNYKYSCHILHIRYLHYMYKA